jgi:urease beta subunit
MRRFFFLIPFLTFWVASHAYAQKAEQLIFNETIHDFGSIDENAGNADFEFTFTNNSGRPINIVSVVASCGCTTPGWTKETIDQGKKGFVKASFNPKGRPGYFNKTLTVNTNLNGPTIVLQIKGTVTSAEMENDVTRLTASNGSLKMRTREINFGKIFINRPAATQEMTVYNAGEKSIRIDSVLAPSYLKVELPDSIKSKQRVPMKVSYNAMLRNQYGFTADKIVLVTNDADTPRKTFPVFATVEEYFLPVASEDADKVPVLSVETGSIDFGDFKMGSTVQKSIKIRNTGKKELLIRYVQPNCPCVTITTDKQKAKPGDEIKVTISWKSEGKHGAQNKAITIYSTDPANPVQRVALTASID